MWGSGELGTRVGWRGEGLRVESGEGLGTVATVAGHELEWEGTSACVGVLDKGCWCVVFVSF
jgi:hypothetical protein